MMSSSSSSPPAKQLVYPKFSERDRHILNDERVELYMLDAEPLLNYASSGFAAFVNRWTDEMVLHYMMSKSSFDKFRKSVSNNYRYLYIIRNVWLALSDTERDEWEKYVPKKAYQPETSRKTEDNFDERLKQNIFKDIFKNSKVYDEWLDRKNYFEANFLNQMENPFQMSTQLTIDVNYSAEATSPHAVSLLKVFLSLDNFVGSLIKSDREKAVELMKQAVNYLPNLTDTFLAGTLKRLLPRSSDKEINKLISLLRGGKASKSSKKSTSTNNLNYQELAFFPLNILEQLLLSNQHMLTSEAVDLREQIIELGVMDFVLICLSHFTRQKGKFPELRNWRLPLPAYSVRFSAEKSKPKEPELNVEEVKESDATHNSYNAFASINKNTQKWAKGTGYGFDHRMSDSSPQWNFADRERKNQYDGDNVSLLLNIIKIFVESCPDEKLIQKAMSKLSLESDNKDVGMEAKIISTTKDFALLLHRSCLCGTLSSYLMCDSLLEIHRNLKDYATAFQLLKVICDAPPVKMSADFLQDDSTDSLEEEIEEQTQEQPERTKLFHLIDVVFSSSNGKSQKKKLLQMLNGFNNTLDQYLQSVDAVRSNKASSSSSYLSMLNPFNSSAFGKEASYETDSILDDEEKALKEINDMCREVALMVQKEIAADTEKDNELEQRDLEQDSSSKYCEVLKDLQFEMIPFTSKIAHHFTSFLSLGNNFGKNTKRIAQEVFSLRSSLPLSLSSSVFVRVSEEQMDVLKLLITGPAGTPYSNGCFEFDVAFPSNYPNSPPQVHLMTTGNGSVRFNPNLYNCGKVCLSLLGTWPGRPEEQWNAEHSSLLQVIVSIQSLILVDEPYFNEPGYENSMHTSSGKAHSQKYNANIQLQTMRWAMLESLKHHSAAFEDVINKHFWLKKEEIVKQAKEWIELEEATSNHGKSVEMKNVLLKLEKEFKKLKGV